MIAADPTLILVTTTAALPREGECGCELCQPETAADRLIASQSRRLTEMHATINDLRAELAKRDKTIKWQAEVIARLTDPSSPANVINKEWWGKLSKAMGKVAKSYTGGNYATLAVSDLIDVWDESDEVDGEPIGDAFGEDASDEEEALVASLPTVAEVVATHDAELNGATDRLAEFLSEDTIKNLKAEIATLKATAAEQAETITKLSEANGRQCDTIMEQTRKLAKRDETIADKDQWIAAANENLALLANSLNEARESRDQLTKLLAEKYDLITSLRAQLARAGAIEEWAKVALDWLRTNGSESKLNPYQVMQGLADALASPSPGPRGTPEGERLAILERVAKRAKAYCDPNSAAPEAYHAMFHALKELDATEATPCPSP